MKSLLFFVLLMLCFCSLSGQIAIKGQVLDDRHEPLGYANVLLLHPKDSSLVKGVVTEPDGTYVISEVEPGRYDLSVQMLGYAEQRQSLVVTKEKSFWIAELVNMAPDAATLDEVVVQARRPLYEHRIDRLVVNVQSSVTSIGGNALQVLAKSPGVRIDGINNQITLEGKQGVLIQINGKRSRIDGEALLQMLAAMPAANIESIELITTPPAAYDAEGVAGIINIVLVKNQEEGTNGNASLNVGYGERPKFGGALDISVRKGKYSLYGGLSVSNDYLQEDVTIDKTIRSGGTLLSTNAFSDRPAFRGFYGGRVGLDYELGTKTIMGVLFSTYSSIWDMEALTETVVLADGELLERSLLSSGERNDWRHWMTNFNLQHTFGRDWELSLDYDYLNYSNRNPADYSDVITDAEGEITRRHEFISRKENPIAFHVFKTDFRKAIKAEWNVEFGAKGSVSNFVNDNLVADIVDGERVNNPRYTNLISMDERIYAAYLSTDFKISQRTSAKAGLRYEYTDIQLDDARAILTSRVYGRFFPTVFLSHAINDDNSLQFAYNERIQRPSLNVLAPAFFFFSPNTLTTGNPRVSASFSQQFRLSYRHKTVMLTAMYIREENPIFWGQLAIEPEENLTITQPENMQDGRMAYLMASFPLAITDWWQSRYEGGVAWQRQRPFFEGELLSNESFFTRINSTQTFTLGDDLVLEVDGYLQSGMIWGLAEMPWQGGFNMGLRKKFNNGSSIALTWEDGLNLGSFWTQSYHEPELNLIHRQEYQREGSIFRLTYASTFGNNKVKTRKDRKGASADERNRVQ